MQRTKPLRGGKDPGLVHKPSASATRPIDSDFAPCLYQRAAPCYSSAWLRWAAASVRFFTSRSPGTLPRTRPLPIYSIYIKAKAVPVAASSSEIASARPTGPELRPRSFTALRIQHSSEDAIVERDKEVSRTPGVRTSRETLSSSRVLRDGIGTGFDKPHGRALVCLMIGPFSRQSSANSVASSSPSRVSFAKKILGRMVTVLTVTRL